MQSKSSLGSKSPAPALRPNTQLRVIRSTQVELVINKPKVEERVIVKDERVALSNASGSQVASPLWSVVSSTTSFGSQLINNFRFWSTHTSTERDEKKVLEEASRKEKEKQRTTVPKVITKFLVPVNIWEMKHIRKLSALCAISYKMYRLTPRLLQLQHNLKLITSSWACEISQKQFHSAPNSVVNEAAKLADEKPESVADIAQSQESTISSTNKSKSPADVVASKLVEAASAAVSVDVITPIASAASTLYSGIVSTTIQTSSKLASAALGVTVAAATAAEIANSSDNNSEDAKEVVPQSTASATCPSEWFVCDDELSGIRYFVIQGSDTLDHWKLNLTFEPVPFESPDLGVKVHKGAYEAAQVLYERFLPLVLEQVNSSDCAKICFTGHSIGGSMATLLAVMYKVRGVLTADQISTVYTFGAPAIFCECYAEETAEKAAISSEALVKLEANAQPSSIREMCADRPGLLASVGLQDRDVRNVIMTRDIVPRAFACDYTSVTDMLKSWGGGFRDHVCLTGDSRTHMYGFVGRVMVLQPDAWHSFVAEADHSMLPPGPGMYTLGNRGGSARTDAAPPIRGDDSCNGSAEQQSAVASISAAVSGAGLLDTRQSGSQSVEPTAKADTQPYLNGNGNGNGKSTNSSGNSVNGVLEGLEGSQISGSLSKGQPSWRHLSVPLINSNNGNGSWRHLPVPLINSNNGNGNGKRTKNKNRSNGDKSVKGKSASKALVSSAALEAVQHAASVEEAVMELMDHPHPLEILGDRGAYLASGSISRYHNPEHYTSALGRLVHVKRSIEGGRVADGATPLVMMRLGQRGEGGVWDMSEPGTGLGCLLDAVQL